MRRRYVERGIPAEARSRGRRDRPHSSSRRRYRKRNSEKEKDFCGAPPRRARHDAAVAVRARECGGGMWNAEYPRRRDRAVVAIVPIAQAGGDTEKEIAKKKKIFAERHHAGPDTMPPWPSARENAAAVCGTRNTRGGAIARSSRSSP